MKGTISHVQLAIMDSWYSAYDAGSAERYRPYHDFEHHFAGQAKRKESVVFVWGSDVK